MRERVNPAEAFAKGGDSLLSNLEVSCVVPVSTHNNTKSCRKVEPLKVIA
jgi:hypothetical protein